MFYQKIVKNLEQWGEKARRLPDQNEKIKQNITNSLLAIKSETVVRKPNILSWMVWVTVPALAILLVINYSPKANLLTDNQSVESYPAPTVAGIADYRGDVSTVEELGIAYGQSAGLSNSKRVETDVMMPPIDYYRTSDITDTREYLKTNVNFNIRTRQVDTYYTRLKTIIRGYGGRIDDSTISDKWARISFAMPKDEYEAFAGEIKEMFPSRFITVRENSTNLLGQKQNIEKQTEYTNSTLDDIKEKQANLIKDHNAKIASWQKEINRLNNLVYSLNKQRVVVSSTDTETLVKLSTEISNSNHLLAIKNQALNYENAQYQKNIAEINNQISNYESRLNNLDEQDTNLINNVETIDGSIELRWISIVNITNLYLSIYKIVIIVGVLIVIWYLALGRRSNMIELP